jgi:hypothetical protein
MPFRSLCSYVLVGMLFLQSFSFVGYADNSDLEYTTLVAEDMQ